MSIEKNQDESIELSINLIKNQTDFPFDLEQIIVLYNMASLDKNKQIVSSNLNYEEIKGLLLQNNIIYNDFIGKSEKFNITDFYRDIIRHGGWIKHLEYQKQVSIDQYENTLLDKATKQSTINVNKLQKKVLWITILGLISSIIIGLCGVLKENRVVIINPIQIDSIYSSNGDTIMLKINKNDSSIK